MTLDPPAAELALEGELAPVTPASRRGSAALLALGLASLGGGYVVGQQLRAGAAPPASVATVPVVAPVAPDTGGLSVGIVREDSASLGEPAPGFELLTPDGSPIRLSDYAGRPVVLNFWATWCGPCKVEMPFLEQAYIEHADRELVVLGVDVREPADLVRSFLEDLGLTFPVALDEAGEVAEDYRVATFPTTYFIARDGRVATRRVGMFVSEADLGATLATILEQ